MSKRLVKEGNVSPQTHIFVYWILFHLWSMTSVIMYGDRIACACTLTCGYK